MSWLARLDIDTESARAEKITDNYSWHKKLWECFPDEPDAKRDFLARIDSLEGAFRLWLLSKRKPVKPDWCHLDSFALNEISPSFLSHQFYAFDLRANPVKSISQRGPDGKLKRGKRVAIVKPDELRDWLIQKGQARCRDMFTGENIQGGFQVVETKESPLEIGRMQENYFRKPDHKGLHGGVQFRGILEVTDQEKFAETYHAGIGSAKGFGFGLFLLAPVNLSLHETDIRRNNHETS